MKKIYPLFLFILFSFFLQAQELYIKGSVTVQANGLVYVQGDVQIDNGGVLDIQSSGANHGKVQVETPAATSPGSWTCNGTTSSTVGGEGEVHFLGTDIDYDVQGSSVTFPNLLINTSTVVTAGVNVSKFKVHDNITISRTLDLNNGRMITDGTKEIYVSNSSPIAIRSTGGFGSNYSNFVEGNLRREIALGNFYRFPIGCTPDATSGAVNNRGYNPAFVDLRGADARKPANATNILAKFIYSADPGTIHHNQAAFSCYSTSTGYQFLELNWMVKRFGYWDLKPNGNYQGWDYDFYVKPDVNRILAQNLYLDHMKIIKAPGTGTINAAYDWSNYVEESGDGCDMVNVYSNQIYWKPGPNTTQYPYSLTDSIRASGLISFSHFGLSGGVGAGVGLPIELLSLRAYPVDNHYINVDWVTATETNNAGFEVQRSTDGVNFEIIGWVAGAGNSSTNIPYNLEDRNVVANQLYYYRLNQIDLNGTATLTYVVSAMITSTTTFTISEFIPNPAQNNSMIRVNTTVEQDINVTVYNTLGQIMRAGDHHLVPGDNQIDFDFNLLADGTYFAIFLADNEVYNRKLILTK